MNLKLSAEDEAFRAIVRNYFAEEYPAEILAKLANGQTLTKADRQASENALYRRGWVAPGWPKQYGGPGWSITQRFIFDEELERAGAPSVVPMGLLYFAPVLYTFGTEEQKRRWLGDILASRTYWAQGYSEPEAGSDLASLRTSAVLDGDDYLVNGEKTWTSDGHHADWIFCLARTSGEGRKQQGITFLCLNMTSPGVTVAPIITIDGGHHLNRVVLDNVRVPDHRRGPRRRSFNHQDRGDRNRSSDHGTSGGTRRDLCSPILSRPPRRRLEIGPRDHSGLRRPWHRRLLLHSRPDDLRRGHGGAEKHHRPAAGAVRATFRDLRKKRSPAGVTRGASWWS